MKKRSILSAVAMLLVSALVLTSATYAWFASGSAASASAITATVANSDGTLLISADGGTTWKTAVAMGLDPTDEDDAYGDFVESTLVFPNIGSSAAGRLIPVSGTPSSGSITFMDGSLEGTAFSSKTATAGWVKVSLKVKSTVATTITVAPAFSTAADFGYCYFVVNSTGYLYGVGAAREYFPIATSGGTVTGVDSNGNAIMDIGDSSHPVLAAQQTTVSQGSYDITAAADTSYDVVFYMWAEGNDAACTGAVASSALSCSVAFTKA